MNPLLKFKLFLISITIFGCSFIYAATAITDSTQAPPVAKKANAIFVQENGYVPDSLSTSSFQTNTKCPPSFSPYVTLSLGEITDQNKRAVSNYKLCVTSLATSGDHVIVNVKQSSTTRTYDAYKMLQPNGSEFWISWDRRYDIGTAETLPSMSYVTGASDGPVTILKKITYTLYCYPQGTAPAIGCS